MKADKALTLAAGFSDRRSYVTPDKREILYGEDWIARKKALWERSGGQCEAILEIIGVTPWRCQREAQIPAHVIPRYPKRDDRLSNLMAYCVEHDRLMEKQSWRRIRSDKAERREQI